MEEGEGKDGDVCCTPNVRDFIYQGVLVLAMGSSEVSTLVTRPNCRDGHGMTYLLFCLHVWPLVGADWGEVLV